MLVPVPDRNKPQKVPLRFRRSGETKPKPGCTARAEGKETVQDILEAARNGK